MLVDAVDGTLHELLVQTGELAGGDVLYGLLLLRLAVAENALSVGYDVVDAQL